ncbi:MAG: hypothetical protein ABH881_00645 [bacterium]
MSKRSKNEVAAIVSAMGVFMTIISNLVELVKKFGGNMEQIYCLATPEGGEKLEAIARLIVSKMQTEFLRLISTGKMLYIGPTDGSQTIAKAKNVFTSGVDPCFVSWGLDKAGKATEQIAVQIYEMAKDSTFVDIFGSLSQEIKRLCLTQSQIIRFAQDHRKWLRNDGSATFFLFEANGEFFVAYVDVYSDGELYVYVYRFEYSDVWNAEYRPRVVVPQLA